MSKLRIAPKARKPAPLTPHEHHRRNCAHAKERLYAVVDALEALEAKGTDHDQLLNLLVTTVIEQIDVLYAVETWLEAVGKKKAVA